MKRSILALAAILAVVPARPVVAQHRTDASDSATLDVQFIDSTEYFITPDVLQGNSEFVAVGRLLLAPGGPSQFLVVGRGAGWEVGQRTTGINYYRTRPATLADLQVGKLVFCFRDIQDGVHRAPLNRDEALNSGWWATIITDVSNLSRNEVSSGNYRMSLSSLRVLR